jgi:hypothetical protein
MPDDSGGLSLSTDRIDVVIAEVKAGPCKLNGPWTNPNGKNVHRVLAAIGCVPRDRIPEAAKQIYQTGFYEHGCPLRIRLVAIGNESSECLRAQYPNVSQVIWRDLLAFMFGRFQRYRHQKAQTDHWDQTGKHLKAKATRSRVTCDEFVSIVTQAMGVQKQNA